MPRHHSILVLTLLAMIAFAANSVLARLALTSADLGPWTYTWIRMISGAGMLLILVGPKNAITEGSWVSASMLLIYAGFFSYAYLLLPTGSGALILFAVVQLTMIGTGLLHKERLSLVQWLGLVLAMSGLVALLAPGIAPPSSMGALLMAVAGAGWGFYSLRGLSQNNPVLHTAGNFARAAAIAVLISPLFWIFIPEHSPTLAGIVPAILSGAITSALGYTIWYRALRGLSASRAGMAQLSVPVLAAIGGVLFIHEPLTIRFLLSSAIVLTGVALATLLPVKS